MKTLFNEYFLKIILPVIFIVIVVFFLLNYLFHQNKDQQNVFLKDTVRHELKLTFNLINKMIEDVSVRILKNKQEIVSGESVLISETMNYLIEHYSAVQTVNLIKLQRKPFVAFSSGNMHETFLQDINKFLLISSGLGKPHISESFKMHKKNDYISLLLPLNDDYIFEVVFILHRLFSDSGNYVPSQVYSLMVMEENELIYKHYNYDELVKQNPAQEQMYDVRLLNKTYQVMAIPSFKLYSKTNEIRRNFMHMLALFINAFFIFLLIILIFSLIKLSKTKRELKRSSDELEKKAAERKLTENSLRNSEEKARSIINATADSVVLVDLDGSLIDYNDEFLSRVNRSTTDMLDKKIWEIIPADLKKMLKLKFSELMETGKSVFFTIYAYDSWFEVTYFPVLDSESKLIGITVFACDITDKRKIEEQLIQSERLAATGQLAASVAHEINSPLQGISSLLSYLTKTHSKDKSLIEDLELVYNAFGSIRDTVQNLLDLNRPSSAAKSEIDVNVVLNSTILLIKSHLKKNKVKLALDLISREFHVYASPQKINQVFINLLNNSIDAISEKANKQTHSEDYTGSISIKTYVTLENFIVEFSDNGPGIPEHSVQKIFDPFYTSKKHLGMGVGLSICRRIIREFEGTITAENSDGGGAKFKIVLPMVSRNKIMTGEEYENIQKRVVV